MTDNLVALGANAITPTSDKAHVTSAGRVGKQKNIKSPDFQGTGQAAQALCFIEGENKAAQYLARLHAQQADPDELAVILSMLYGAVLRGFCRVVEKALGARR